MKICFIPGMPTLYPRHAASVVSEHLAYFPAVLVEGARQVGKSTLVRTLFRDGEAKYLTLDDEATRDAAIADPAGFVDSFPAGTLIIDEIRRLPGLTLPIKASIDRDRRPGRFLLTGSSSLLRIRGTQDSLAGRVSRISMMGLSQGEIAGNREDFAAMACAPEGLENIPGFTSSVTRAAYIECCAAGSYPEALALPLRLANQWRDNYLDSIVRRDLPELQKSVSSERVFSILRLLAGAQSNELVRSKLAEDSVIPASTVASYLDLISDVQLYKPLNPWTPNLRAREVNRPKIIVLDSGLAMRLSRVTGEQLQNLNYQEAFGQFLEGFVVAELFKQKTWSAVDFGLFHYRDRNGLEVDIILEFEDGRVLALEIKASTSFNARQFQGLAALRDDLGDRFIGGIVLNTGAAGYRYSEKLWGLPISALWQGGLPA
jgi:predicted AAA+ superfamily ATPase